jgi:uroporphyrinogen-III synthase
MKRVLVTRPRAAGNPLVRGLLDAGLETICVPTIAIAPPADESLETALHRIEDFDWLVATSANAAPSLARRIPSGVQVAAIGPATAAALARAGIPVDHVPDDYLSAAVVGGMGPLHGREILLARGDAATPQLADALIRAGGRVTEAIAYRTLEGPDSSREAVRAALESGVDGIVFASGSAVRGLLALLTAEWQRRVRDMPALCIGPVTAVEASASGFGVAVVARTHTGVGLAQAIADHVQLQASA